MGTFSNIDCANVEFQGKVLRLVSLRSFLGIVGVNVNSKGSVNDLMNLLENRNTKTAASERIAGIIRNGYSLDDGSSELNLDSRVLTKFCRFMLSLRAIHKIKGVYLDMRGIVNGSC